MSQRTVTAVNDLHAARPGETIELRADDLTALGAGDMTRVHVRDEEGRELLCQAVDADGDAKPDRVVFQADFAAGQSRTFTVAAGPKTVYTREQFRAYGRFVRERYEDFCWENDRIAHRMYGRALETADRIPLISSTVDIWSKRTTRLVINDWYMVDNYHGDTGEGGDFYSAGQSRGCGGNGLWAADRLWVSRNFVSSRVLACGPIRLLFELTYEAFDVDGLPVSEVKRISLDAGQNLNHFQSIYRPCKPAALVSGIGLKKVAGEHLDYDAEQGRLSGWEPMEMEAGEQGLALIVDPRLVVQRTHDALNHLLLVRVPPDDGVSYWAGFCWDRSGQFPDAGSWTAYVDRFTRGLRSPIRVTVSNR
jgi:hypothetical protein